MFTWDWNVKIYQTSTTLGTTRVTALPLHNVLFLQFTNGPKILVVLRVSVVLSTYQHYLMRGKKRRMEDSKSNKRTIHQVSQTQSL